MYEVSVVFPTSSKEYRFVMEKIPCFFTGKKFFIENESGYDYRKAQVKINVIYKISKPDKDLKKIVKITDAETGIQYDCREGEVLKLETTSDCKWEVEIPLCVNTTVDTGIGVGFSDNTKIAFGNFQATAAEVGENLKKLSELLNENKNENKGDNNMFNFEFGKANNTGAGFSMYGLTFGTGDNSCIAYKDGGWVDVPKEFIIKGMSDMLYMMPVAKKEVKANDYIRHNGRWVRVIEVTDTTLKAEDIYNKTVIEILPTRSPFGFDFYTKLVNMFDGFGGEAKASAENPFGNMWMFMLMGDSKSNFKDMLPFMMMNGDFKFDMSNPMMMYFLLNK